MSIIKYRKFIEAYKGIKDGEDLSYIADWTNDDIKRSYEANINAHNNLNKALGSQVVKFSIDSTSKTVEKFLTNFIKSDIQNYYPQYIEYIENYLKHYGLTWASLAHETVSPKGTKNKFKLSKHLNTYLKTKYPKEWDKGVASLYYSIVDARNYCCQAEDAQSVIISTLPEDFAHLGHYGVDPYSCFGKGYSREENKFSLSEKLNNSFVALVVSKKPIDITEFHDDSYDDDDYERENEYIDYDKPIMQRAFGIVDFKDNIICLGNIYPDNKNGSLLLGMCQFYHTLFKNIPNVYSKSWSVESTEIYMNDTQYVLGQSDTKEAIIF